MIRFIIPLIAVLLFFFEPVFSLFSPVDIGGERYTLVPRFVIVYLIFLAVYYNRRLAVIYGIVFGLLYDMFHIDIIGLYAFLYPMICLLAVFLIKQTHKHFITVMFLSLLMIIVLEMFSYFFAGLISLTSISLSEFILTRLFPTMIANLIFIVMFSWFFKNLIYDKGILQQDDIM